MGFLVLWTRDLTANGTKACTDVSALNISYRINLMTDTPAWGTLLYITPPKPPVAPVNMPNVSECPALC